VCHKIGTNYSPSSKGFFIDSEARIIKFKNLDAGTKLEGIGNQAIIAMAEPADEQEEYEALIYPQNADKKRIQARKVSYSRYRQYVENEISVDVIAPIRQYWLTHIIELIPGDLHAVEKERIEYLIDTMLNEINKDYFDSVRKSILDYILKNEQEMKRLGIQQVLNQPTDWGDDFYKGIEPNEEWKHNVMMARMLMSENLCICSQATLELMKLWQDYKAYLFVNLPQPREDPVAMIDFLSNQEAQMNKVKGLLTSDWNKSAVDILREELENIEKDQTKTFFESVSTLMANQMRELIEQSVDKYVAFIQRYSFKEYPSAEEVMAREYDADTPFEDSFLTLRLTISDQQITFTDPLDNVHKEMEEIIDSIIKQSNNIPRPENTIARSDKMHLWDVQADDEIVINAKNTISKTLLENLEVTKQCIRVYDKYIPLLKEKSRIEEFLNKEPFDRAEFQAEVNRYHATVKEIRNTMPFEIRMNMFLVNCQDINNLLCEECEGLIDTILNKVGDFVFSRNAPEISTAVKTIQEEVQ
jgi:dynein heavy chain